MSHLQNVQTQDMNLVLSTDAKPRLKWTPELHQRFVNAVNELGGPEKATPKGLMRVMGIQGLTLYHLKSHLQKYRLGKNHQQSETCSETKPDSTDCNEIQSMDTLNLFREENETNNPIKEQNNEDVRISEAIKLQMEVQKKLHEQIEVQRHLQLRIEAQGKYLQKVLKKAQETLLNYNNSSNGVEHAKAEISQLVSMVSSSSISEITENTDLTLDHNHNHNHMIINHDDDHNHMIINQNGCSVESSLTSSESSGQREEEKCLLILPLLSEERTEEYNSRKRRNLEEKTGCSKKLKQEFEEEIEMGYGLRKFGFLGTIDLNRKCENELDFSPRKTIDLNSKE